MPSQSTPYFTSKTDKKTSSYERHCRYIRTTKSKIIEAFCYLTTALCVASKALRFELIFQVGLHPKNYSINQQVVQEASDYRDILIQDFYEHYTNLSVKSVMILKYISEDLTTKPHFLLKVLKANIDV